MNPPLEPIRQRPRYSSAIGRRYERLIVLSVTEWDRRGPKRVVVQCDCGEQCVVRWDNVRHGRTKSCGCYRRELEAMDTSETPLGHPTHRLSGTRTHKIWRGIKHRCSNPNSSVWEYYGGRGITVCERWRDSFEAFLADMGEAPDGLSIDRIDNDGDYEPGNCRWATAVEQMANRRCSTNRG